MGRLRREWPVLDPLVFGGALVAHAAGLPRGLGLVASAAAVSGVLEPGAPGPLPPLGLLAARLVALVPLGDLATRAALASAVLGAVAVTALARLACDLLAAARPDGERSAVEPLAAAGAAAAFALTSGAFDRATSVGAVPATLAVVTLGWVALARVLRDRGRSGAGLALGLACGLAAGAQPIAAPLLWPGAVAAWLWALRRGERWPLIAPLLAVAGLAVVLAPVATVVQPATAAAVVAPLWPPRAAFDGAELRAPAVELGEQLGVVALMLGAAGALAFLRRTPHACALVLLALAVPALWGAAALPIAGAIVVLPIAAGIAQIAARVGRARVAAAAALAVLAALPPALDGGTRRWTHDGRGAGRLLGHALADLPLRAAVDPGTPQMDGLLRYGAAMGLRPDLALAPAPRRATSGGVAGVATTP